MRVLGAVEQDKIVFRRRSVPEEERERVGERGEVGEGKGSGGLIAIDIADVDIFEGEREWVREREREQNGIKKESFLFWGF